MKVPSSALHESWQIGGVPRRALLRFFFSTLFEDLSEAYNEMEALP